MNRILSGLLLIVPLCASATPVSNVLVDMESGSSGSKVTTALAASATHGSGVTWSITGNLWVTNSHESTLRGPLNVAGTTYPDSGSTRSWTWVDGVASQYAQASFAAVPSLVVSAFLTSNATPGSNELHDTINVGIGNVWAVCQVQTYSGAINLNIESNHGGTTHSGIIPITRGQTYWVTFRVNAGGGLAELKVFDPSSSYSVVGSVSVAMDAGTVGTVRIGRPDTHLNTGTTFSYLDDIVINWTDTTFPFVPATGGSAEAAPTISSQPSDQSVTLGQPATFGLTASGNPDPTYQWQRNNGSGWADIGGATNSIYTLPNAVQTDSGAQVHCFVSNNAGSVISRAAALTVSAVSEIAPTITSQPANKTVVAGQSATFSVTASGNPTPTYQWLRNNGSGWVVIFGATVSSYTITSAAIPDDGAQFSCVVSNSAGSVSSGVATLSLSAVVAANLIGGIPVQNAPTNFWAAAGVPGGIPNRTLIYLTLNPSATAAQIVSAVKSCPSNQVVYLKAGTYNISPIDFGDPGPTYCTLRGDGMGKTILNVSSGQAAINAGSYPPWFGSWGNSQAITGGGTQGSSTIIVANTSSYSVGDMCVIDMTNSDWIQGYGTGGGTAATYNNDSAGKGRDGNNVQLHLCRITARTSNMLTLDPPLPFALDSAREPQIFRASQRPGPISFGIEDLTVNASGASTHGIFLNGSYGSWLKNVELTQWGHFGMYLRWNTHFEMRGCYIHDPNSYAVDHGYGILIDPCSACLIEDNIVYNCQSTILLQGGCTLNVLSYNVFAFGKYVNGGYTGEWLQHEINGNHTPFPAYNLFEGNYTGKFQADYYYGPSGWGTLFRNRIPGNSSSTTLNRYAVSIDSNQRNYSIVGNQLGERTAPTSLTLALPGVTRAYAGPGSITWKYDPGTANFSTPYIYRLGYPYSGNNSTGGGTAVQDPLVKTTTLRHGNWDASNNAVVWDPGIPDHTLPPSLFLTSKPSWFGNLVWPPYGPEAPAGVTNDLAKIPAGYRLLYNSNPENSILLPTSPKNPHIIPVP